MRVVYLLQLYFNWSGSVNIYDVLQDVTNGVKGVVIDSLRSCA